MSFRILNQENVKLKINLFLIYNLVKIDQKKKI